MLCQESVIKLNQIIPLCYIPLSGALPSVRLTGPALHYPRNWMGGCPLRWSLPTHRRLRTVLTKCVGGHCRCCQPCQLLRQRPCCCPSCTVMYATRLPGGRPQLLTHPPSGCSGARPRLLAPTEPTGSLWGRAAGGREAGQMAAVHNWAPATSATWGDVTA